MELKDYTTKELVEELSKRVGVAETVVAPHEEETMRVQGPAIVLVVID